MATEVLALLTVPLIVPLPPCTGEKLFLDQMSNVPVPLSVFCKTVGVLRHKYLRPGTEWSISSKILKWEGDNLQTESFPFHPQIIACFSSFFVFFFF